MPDGFTCPVCLDVVAGARVSQCGHLFCGSCYWAMVARKPECAVCRAELRSAPYPSFELDERLVSEKGAAHGERVARSRSFAREREAEARALNRVQALAVLLVQCEQDAVLTCAGVPRLLLQYVCHSAVRPESAPELLAAWRVVLHLVTYCRDAETLGIEQDVLGALLSPHASVASTRAVTRCVELMIRTRPFLFAALLEPDTAERLLTAAPAALALAALALGTQQLGKLLCQLIVRVHDAEPETARLLLDKAIKESRPEVRSAVTAMFTVDALHFAEPIANACWNDGVVALVIASQDLEGLVGRAAESRPDLQAAVLDLLHAVPRKDPALVLAVLSWVLRPLRGQVRELAESYVSMVVRRDAACALAVRDACDVLELDRYVVGDVFSHEATVRGFEDRLAALLKEMAFETYGEVYFAASLARSHPGCELLREHAIVALNMSLAHADEVNEATVQETLTLIHEYSCTCRNQA